MQSLVENEQRAHFKFPFRGAYDIEYAYVAILKFFHLTHSQPAQISLGD